MTGFALHPRLAADTVFVADWALSRVLLMNDTRYPWLVLVPQRPHLVELHDLNAADRATLIEEISLASRTLKTITGAAKINVGALGNLVAQLHVHVVARKPGDHAWPKPVWGRGSPSPYAPAAREAFLNELARSLP
ncbi:MAG TPA: HIT family protein [Rhizomicrobium sp.]|nr:HIT family protein [Rhizomicrobium sp.]